MKRKRVNPVSIAYWVVDLLGQELREAFVVDPLQWGGVMDVKRAIEIICALADGVDPHTGEMFSAGSPYQNPETVRALFEALKGLEVLDSRSKRTQSLPQNAGKSWSKEEDQLLVSRFESGTAIKDLSVQHARTQGAIHARLIKLGKLTV